MYKPVRVDEPYPSTDSLTPDPCAAAQLARAYATGDSEFTAVSQYIFHHFNFYCMGMNEYADELENIAITEMTHLDLLGKAIIKMGQSPVFTATPPRLCNFFSTSGVKYSATPQKMLCDDIAAEEDAIALYRQILSCLNNEQAIEIVKRIILDEELHLQTFKKMLQNLSEC